MLVPKDNSKFRYIFCPVRAPSTMPYECIESRSTNRRGMMYGCGDRVMYNVGMSSWVPSTVSISNSTTLVLHYSSTTSTTILALLLVPSTVAISATINARNLPPLTRVAQESANWQLKPKYLTIFRCASIS